METKSVLSLLVLGCICSWVTERGTANGAEHNYTALVTSVTYDAASKAYLLDLPLGTPPQRVHLTLDVERSGAPSVPCGRGDGTTTSMFDPFLSSTFRPGPAAAAKDRVTLAAHTVNFTIDPARLLVPLPSSMQFRCLPAETPVNGRAGFGSAGNLALPLQISKKAGVPRQFGYCLPSLVFFGRPEAYIFTRTYYLGSFELGQMEVDLIIDRKNQSSYAVALHNVSVDGVVRGVELTGLSRSTLKRPVKLRISTLEPYTKLPTPLYRALRSSFRQAIGYNTSLSPAVPPVPPFDTCFDASAASWLTNRMWPNPTGPTISLELGGTTWILPPRNYFVATDGLGDWSKSTCLGFVDAGRGQPAVLGTLQQQDFLLQFDLQRSVLGFKRIFEPSELHPLSCFEILNYANVNA